MIKSITQTSNFTFTDVSQNTAQTVPLEQLTQKFAMFALGGMMLLMMDMNATRITLLKSFEFTCSLQEL